jgi:SAM-dependent methyltransferase
VSIRTRLAGATDPERFQLRPSGPGRVLDVGCGSKKYPGAVGIDVSAETDADLVLDLDEPPYEGLADDSFDQIICQDVIEHVRDPFAVMRELHRVARPGARVHLRRSHFSSVLAYSDPTHRHVFSAIAVESLAQPGFAHYTRCALPRGRRVTGLLDPVPLAGYRLTREPIPAGLRDVLRILASRDECPG